MKNRRNIIVAFLLCACLLVGVGYAAFSDVMDINGSSELNANEVIDGNIFFTDAKALPREGVDTTPNTANVNINNKDKASFTVKDVLSVGDKSQFQFTIKNTNSTPYEIKVKALNYANKDAEDYFKITADWGDQVQTIGVGQSINVIITVEMETAPTDLSGISASFLIELSVMEPTTV